MGARAATGLVFAAGIALAARWRRALSTSGAVAAIAVATASWSADWTWGVLLIAFFVSSTLLTRVGHARKRRLLDDIVEKGSERDWKQVAANGGVFAAAAIAGIVWPAALWQFAGAGALAAATADTWATEAGTIGRGQPRSIITWQKVPIGTSGGVSVTGTLAALAGALFIAIAAVILRWPFAVLFSSFTAGFSASIVDSVLGAAVQCRRWCRHCGRGTERAVHTCGNATDQTGGILWLDNDMVNLASTLSGAIIGAAFIL